MSTRLGAVAIALLLGAGAALSANNPYNLEIHFAPDSDQETLHRHCPDAPANRIIVACSAIIKTERGSDSHILFAPDKIVFENSKWKTSQPFMNQFQNCIRIMEQETIPLPRPRPKDAPQ
jgi:hypothetical protein